jgi:hypothetical protein
MKTKVIEFWLWLRRRYTFVLLLLLFVSIGINVYHWCAKVKPQVTTEYTVSYDTIPGGTRTENIAERHTVATLTRRLPVIISDHQGASTESDSAVAKCDSATVAIPITQTHYVDSTYEAWVSGYEAKLDSINLFRRTVTKTVTQVTIDRKPKRLSIGLQGGYGMTPKGMQPYLGVGISLRLW